MNERQRRIGENEAVFRKVNERLAGLNATFATVSHRIELICECGDSSCSRQLTMSVEDYEQLRSDPHLFVVVPGHAAAHVEDIVLARPGYEIVRKAVGDPARLAEQTDPRAV